MKHPYSIYRKMFSQNKRLDEIFDLFAFRVIVGSVGTATTFSASSTTSIKAHLGPSRIYQHPNPTATSPSTPPSWAPTASRLRGQIRTEEMRDRRYGVAATGSISRGGAGAGAPREV